MLLRATAFCGVLAAVMGMVIAPGMRGTATEKIVQATDRIAGTLAYVLYGLVIALLIRGGYEWRLAKHWAVQTVGGYRPTGTRFLNGTTAGAVSGIEFGIGISGFL